MALVLVLAALVLATLSTPFIDRLLGRGTGWVLAAVFLALTVVVAAQAPAVLGSGTLVEGSLPWMPTIDVALDLRMDATAWLFSMLVLGIGALVMAYSARYFPPGRRTGFYFQMTAFATAMQGLVLADDVVVMFVFWELTTICSFFLIGLSGVSATRPAVRTYLVTALGGLALLAAVIMLAVRTGTTSLSVILADTSWLAGTFGDVVVLLVIVAVFTKSAQFPFHYWLPDAMAASTPVSTYLHAATMVKAGIYLAMRFSPAFAGVPLWQVTLVTVGLFTAFLGAVFALQRHDLKELLAYSTVSQLGLLVAVIGVGTPTALAAAAVHTVAHALFKSALFMLVGVIDHEQGTRDIRELGPLRRAMPVTGVLVALGAASMAGLPPLLGFVSKESLFSGFLDLPGAAGALAAAAAVLASIGTFAYSWRIVHGAFGGPAGEPAGKPAGERAAQRLAGERAARPAGLAAKRTGRPEDAADEQVRRPDGPADEHARREPLVFLAPPATTALAGVVVGLAVPLLDPLARGVVADTTGASYEPHLALWHGLNLPLAMSAVVIGVGALLAWQQAAVGRALDRPLFPARGTGVFERVHAAIITLGARTADLTRSDSPAPFLGTTAVMLVLLAGVQLVARPAVPDFPAEVTHPLDWVLVGLILASVGAAVVVRSRLAALSLVGITGFTVALWFQIVGGADLVLTQLLVEVLTVVIAVLVLRRLPRHFKPATRRRTVVTAAIALATGLAAALAVYTLTGRRERSPASDYFMRQAEEDTGGTNVVNVILVDYRALDTLGELTVLGVAGLVMMSVIRSSRLTAFRVPPNVVAKARNVVYSARHNVLVVSTVARYLQPVIIVWSLYLLVRGHQNPGGGFIAALVGGAAFALAYLSAARGTRKYRIPPAAIIGAGIATGVVAGLLGFADGSFLRALHAYIPLPWGGYYHFTTALIFDVGVYLAVIGVVLAALEWLGDERDAEWAPGEDGTPLDGGTPHAVCGFGQAESVTAAEPATAGASGAAAEPAAAAPARGGERR